MIVVLVGAPGSGKGTQAKPLSEKFGIAHVASGDMFRENLKNGTELGKLAESYMSKGALVPDDVTIRMVLERISRPDCAAGVILDGFPRTIDQAKALDDALARMGKRVDVVTYVKVADEELLRRLSGRWICRTCGASYHTVSNPPKQEGVCDHDGGPLYQRDDDTIDVARNQAKGLLRGDRADNRVLPPTEASPGSPRRAGHRSRDQRSHSGHSRRTEGVITIKSKSEFDSMRKAGRLVADTLERLRVAVKPGVSTADLDRIAYENITKNGGIPSFKGYHGFPASICTSVNDEVVHGIPNKRRVLAEGDVISLDCGAIIDGWHGDAAITVAVGKTTPENEDLMRVTEESLYKGIEQVAPGHRIGDISAVIQQFVEAHGYSIVREYVGHGIGRAMHEDPQVPNWGTVGRGMLLKDGMALALEPMVNAGAADVKVLDDHWTVVTKDGMCSAHFEHTVAVLESGPEVLTKL